MAQSYRAVVDAYELRRVDFDIEGSALAETASIDRRAQALANVQQALAAEGRPLEISFTLPAEASGLTDGGLFAVRSAIRHGVELSAINVRPIRGTTTAAPHSKERMGVYSIEAAISVFYQLENNLPGDPAPEQTWRKIGITPTIGRGETEGESFQSRDAQAICDFARQQGLGMLSLWSLNRDQYDSQAASAADLTSGIKQAAFEFSDIFRLFDEK